MPNTHFSTVTTGEQLHHEQHHVDVCVIGGGMAGICAAIASARNGAQTVLIHDRHVLGGNASSEIRMWICGAHGKHNKETGILEEIQLANLHRNPGLNYSIWDSVLYEKCFYQPNLTTLLNTSVNDAAMDGTTITSVKAWQTTTQTWHNVSASQFVDCSGDSILAPLTGAACRRGREAASEFKEDIEPDQADGKTMGNSLLIQMHRTDERVRFTPPRWAYRFESPEDLQFRVGKRSTGGNFWWIEVGGLEDTIRDGERIRDELMKVVYGVWDYFKNIAPEREKVANFDLHWIGAHPGKRENRRYEGDFMMSQRDVEARGAFDDVVAFGGWSMDDHHPAGLYFPGKPTIFHPAPSPYGIAYRSLYSRNIDNLLFAGRNISVTHAALSSTRVMATCAVIGQAAGTAAAMCTRLGCSPRTLGQQHLTTLQQTLMFDDCFLPGFDYSLSDMTQAATLSGQGDGLALLRDGFDRDREGQVHAWTGSAGDTLEFAWQQDMPIEAVRLVFDSDLNNDKRMPCAYPVSSNRNAMPGLLAKAFTLETCDAQGNWQMAARVDDNVQRLVELKLGKQSRKLRLRFDANWSTGEKTELPARLFSLDVLDCFSGKLPEIPEGLTFQSVVNTIKPEDLKPPAKDDTGGKRSGHSA